MANEFKAKNGLIVADGIIKFATLTSPGLLYNTTLGVVGTSGLNNGLSFNSGTNILTLVTQMSLSVDGSGIRLSGDVNSPGNNMLYGTNGTGVKGWYAQPGGGSTPTLDAVLNSDNVSLSAMSTGGYRVIPNLTDAVTVNITTPFNGTDYYGLMEMSHGTSDPTIVLNSSNGLVTGAVFNITGLTSFYSTLQITPAISANRTVTLPDSSGTLALQEWVTAQGYTAIPSQTGNSGKYLTTNGSVLSWATVAAGGSGTVNSGAINQLAWYAAAGTAVSGNSSVLWNGTNTLLQVAGGVYLNSIMRLVGVAGPSAESRLVIGAGVSASATYFESGKGWNNDQSNMFAWRSGTGVVTNTAWDSDTAIARSAAGTVEINSGTIGQYRDLKAREIVLSTTTQNTGLQLGVGTYYAKIMANLASAGFNPLISANDVGFVFFGASVGAAQGFIITPQASTGSGLRMDGSGNIYIGGSGSSKTKFTSTVNPATSYDSNVNYNITVQPYVTGAVTQAHGIAFGGNATNTTDVSAAILVDGGSYNYADLNFMTRPSGGSMTKRLIVYSTGVVAISNLAGTGTRSVVVDASGNLSAQTISSGTSNGTITPIGATGNIVATNNQFVLADATSAGFTASLPSASGNSGMVIRIKKIDSTSNIVTVASLGGTIDGGTTALLKVQYASITCVSDGTNWNIF